MGCLQPVRVLLALLFFAISPCLSAEQKPLDLATVTSGTEISAHVIFLKEDDYRLPDIISGNYASEFTALGAARQFSRTSGAYWFRVRVTNSSPWPLERLLVIQYPSHQKIDYFEVDHSSGEIRSRHRDARALINEVDIRHRLPIYTVSVGAGETRTLFLRVASPTIRTNMEIWAAKDFLAEARFAEWWFLVFLGVILAASIYSAVIAATSRSPLYISLFLVTVMMLLTQFTMHGHVYQIFGAYGGAFNLAWLLIQTWTAASVVVFSYIFLNGAQMGRGYRISMILLAIALLLTGLGSLLDYRSGLLFTGPLMTVGSLLLLTIATHQIRQKNRDAVLYLIAWLPIMVLAVLVGLNGFGLLGFAALGSAVVSAWIPTTIFVFGFCVIFRTRSEHRESMGKSSFLAVMSHEVRTPLTGILGTVALLGASPLNSRQKRLVDNLRNAGNTLLTLLDEVLQLSRFEAGQAIELNLSPADPVEVTRSVVSLMTPRADTKGTKLEFITSGVIPKAVLIDEARLRQVLLNLISNAVKFTDRGHVLVELAVAPCLNEQVSLKISVTDAGIGIAPDKLPMLFQPYSQIDMPHREGTGLGLYISQQIVELMGGKIVVDSQVGVGSQFAFTIDVEIATLPAELEAAQTTMDNRAHGEKLLLVDDIALNREVISELLHNVGFAVTTAEDGAVALDLFRRGRFDAVVLDAFMPTMSGLQVAQQLREMGAKCPILGLSAATEPELVSACLESGMNRVFRKPANMELLTSTLLELIRLEQQNYEVSILNLEILDSLKDAVGASRYDELCSKAIVSVRDQLDELALAFSRQDTGATQQVTHRLAGTASSVGLERLGHLAEQLSASLRKGDSTQFNATKLDAISALASQSLAALQSTRDTGVSG